MVYSNFFRRFSPDISSFSFFDIAKMFFLMMSFFDDFLFGIDWDFPDLFYFELPDLFYFELGKSYFELLEFWIGLEWDVLSLVYCQEWMGKLSF